MNSSFFTLKNIGAILLVFFIYICISPAVRLLLIGGGEMKNIAEFVLTALPDFLFMVVAVIGLIGWFKGNRFEIVFFDKVVFMFILFNTVYGFVLSRNVFISAQGFRITYLPVIFYFIGRAFSSNKSISEKVAGNIFSWFMVFGVIGLILHFAFRSMEVHLIELSGHLQTAYFIPRIGSLVLMPVLFATMMAMAALYFYFRVLKGGDIWHYIAIAILWSCIFLAVSRGPIMAFLISFLFFTFFFKQWKRSLAVFGIICLVSSFWSYILVGSFAPIAWLFSSAADTLEFGAGITRVELWKRSIHDFMTHPWGYGLGHAGVVAIRFLKGTDTPAAVYTSDGWFLKILCETGIPGLASYLFLCGVFFFKGIRFIFKDKSSFFTLVFAVFLMINAQCIVGNTLDFYPYVAVYWLLLGFAVNFMSGKIEPKHQKIL
jgi:hypothetical protein